MKRLLCLGLAAGLLSACNGTAPMMAAAPRAQQPVQAQSDAGVRNAIKTTFELGFQAKDQNRDSFLTQEESTMTPADFTKADVDKDKKLSLKEFLYASNKISQSAFQYIKNASYQAFAMLDRNHDAYFSLDELQASLTAAATPGQQSVQSTLFFVADRNRDKKLSLSEYEDVAAWTMVGSLTGSPAANGPVTPAPSGGTPPGQGAVIAPPPPPVAPVPAPTTT